MTRLTVEFGSDIRASLNTGELISFRTRHEAILLGSLALAAPLELDRRRLAAELWPESDSRMAAQNLRQRLSNLRASIGSFLQSDRIAASIDARYLDLRGLDGESATLCRDIVDSCMRRVEGSGGWTDQLSLLRLSDAILDGNVVVPPAGPPPKELSVEGLVVLSYAADSTPGHRQIVLRIVSTLTPVDEEDPVRRAYWAFIHHRCAAIAHTLGEWQRGIMHEQESRRFAKGSSQPWRGDWAAFRWIRKQIDVSLTAQRCQALTVFRHRPNLTDKLGSFVDLNLVHAHALRGNFSDSMAAARRCRLSASYRGDLEIAAWLHLNEAIAASLSGDHRRALDHLVEAADANSHNPLPSFNYWHWAVGAKVFAVAGKPDQTATLFTLFERARKQDGTHATPTTAWLLNRFVSHVAAKSDSRSWMRAVVEAEALPLEQGQVLYRSLLTQGL